ncbi:MAG: SH3 domain-containing protein, partial [Treponema sp.]|nr:SH3 domain-containing protein [Treponema sp.]
MTRKKLILPVLICTLAFMFFSCSSRLGYGVLLWSIEDPQIESGTVLPVFVRSNIEKRWVVGLPESDTANKNYKFEISLYHLEFAGNKKQAQQRSEEFAPYARLYAENLQDRLPVREHPDNGSRYVYRLRLGEIIKILEFVEEGVDPIGTTGDPLEGEWYKVMTSDGVIGYCFSYRLRIFDENNWYAGIEYTAQADLLAEIENSLPVPESAQSIASRRENQYMNVYYQGPVYSSSNYGRLTLATTGAFTWTGFELLVPHIIPSDSNGTGLIRTTLGISADLSKEYDGVFTFEFNNARSY